MSQPNPSADDIAAYIKTLLQNGLLAQNGHSVSLPPQFTLPTPATSGTLNPPTTFGTLDPPAASGTLGPPATSGAVDPPTGVRVFNRAGRGTGGALTQKEKVSKEITASSSLKKRKSAVDPDAEVQSSSTPEPGGGTGAKKLKRPKTLVSKFPDSFAGYG